MSTTQNTSKISLGLRKVVYELPAGSAAVELLDMSSGEVIATYTAEGGILTTAWGGAEWSDDPWLLDHCARRLAAE